jgi:hypothetical protein
VIAVATETSPASEQTEVVRWYTHARRFPILIGKAGMNGDPLPGGPYTSTQVVGWFGTLAAMYFTRDVWGQFSGFTNGVLLLGVPILVGWAARWIPHDARNPVLVAAGWVRCFGAPPAGRVDGVPVRLRNAYRMRHQIVVDPRSYSRRGSRNVPPDSAVTASDERGRNISATSAPADELTGVQALLVKGR